MPLSLSSRDQNSGHEFYSLVERHQDGTPDMIGMEAVNQLLIALEKHRFDFCFLAAGYEDQVDEFLTVNPGLASRFNRKIRFESYSPEELVEIGQRYGSSRATVLNPDAQQRFLEMMVTIRSYVSPQGEHGINVMHNGRFARNVIEEAELARDTRVAAQKRAGHAVTIDDLKTITAVDIDAAVRAVSGTKREMATITW